MTKKAALRSRPTDLLWNQARRKRSKSPPFQPRLLFPVINSLRLLSMVLLLVDVLIYWWHLKILGQFCELRFFIQQKRNGLFVEGRFKDESVIIDSCRNSNNCQFSIKNCAQLLKHSKRWLSISFFFKVLDWGCHVTPLLQRAQGVPGRDCDFHHREIGWKRDNHDVTIALHVHQPHRTVFGYEASVRNWKGKNWSSSSFIIILFVLSWPGLILFNRG